MKAVQKKLTILTLVAVMIVGMMQFCMIDAKAESSMQQMITMEACSLWAQPNTSAENKIKVLPVGYLVKVYPNLVLSTKDDGKVFYRTAKGSYILARCVQEIPKTRLTDGFVVTSETQATYQALRQQQEALDVQEMASYFGANPTAGEKSLEAKYGINIKIPANYMKDPTTYAVYLGYINEALGQITPEWIQMVAKLSKAQTGKTLTISVKESSGIYLAGEVADGVYYYDSNTVSLRSIDATTLAHEIGHALYYVCRKKIPKFDATWMSYNNGIAYVGSNYWNVDFTYADEQVFTGSYAMQNANEDFAETCAYLFTWYTESLMKGYTANQPYLNKKVQYIRDITTTLYGKRII